MKGHLSPITTKMAIVEQFGFCVSAFTSQYGGENGISYTVSNLAGPLYIYPGYGDFTQACVFRTYGPWWKICPSAAQPIGRKQERFISEDYAELSYQEKVRPTGIEIFETYNPGCVVKILACDTMAGTDVDTGQVRWVTLWEGSPQRAERKTRVFSPPLSSVNFYTDLIRLEFSHVLCDYYTELDGVKLIGVKEPCEKQGAGQPVGQTSENVENKATENTCTQRQSSTDDTVNFTCSRLENCQDFFCGSIRILENFCEPLTHKRSVEKIGDIPVESHGGFLPDNDSLYSPVKGLCENVICCEDSIQCKTKCVDKCIKTEHGKSVEEITSELSDIVCFEDQKTGVIPDECNHQAASGFFSCLPAATPARTLACREADVCCSRLLHTGRAGLNGGRTLHWNKSDFQHNNHVRVCFRCFFPPEVFFGDCEEEVVQLILSYLDTSSLCRLAQTCRLLSSHCYDPMQFTELNLKPFWATVNDQSLRNLASRCTLCQGLDLSWCGNHGLVTISGLKALLTVCGSRLTCLRLGNCGSVNAAVTRCIAALCPTLHELDVQSCPNLGSGGFRVLAGLRQLRRLNLYRTQVDPSSIIDIVRGCRQLEHLNLGSCINMSRQDEVLSEIATNCLNLKSLDLWRWKCVTEIGISAIATNCPRLQEIDLGWVSSLRSPSGCYRQLAHHCHDLRKLVCTANRSVCDEDLDAIARFCPDLEQLDILGTGEVSLSAARRILDSCKKLKFFDVSFCRNISFQDVKSWLTLYPRVSIKQSFQT